MNSLLNINYSLLHVYLIFFHTCQTKYQFLEQMVFFHHLSAKTKLFNYEMFIYIKINYYSLYKIIGDLILMGKALKNCNF